MKLSRTLPLSRFVYAHRNAVLAMTMWIALAFTGVSQAQFLKPGETAPAPEFRGVTEWINSDPLTMDCPAALTV